MDINIETALHKKQIAREYPNFSPDRWTEIPIIAVKTLWK